MKKNIYKYKKYLLFIIPIIIFAFVLLGFWPGIYTYDGNNQWGQVVSGDINNAHPFLSTYFILLISKIWNSQTIVIIYQIILFSIIWYIICKDLLNEKKSYKSILIYTIIMCLVPIISIYAITVWKDIIYSYYLLLISYFLYKGAKVDFDYKSSSLIIMGLLLGLVFSYRHNGMIVSILLLLFLLIIFIRKKINYKKCLIIFITFIAFLGIVSVPKNYYLSRSDKEIDKDSTVSIMDNYMTWIMGTYIVNDYISDDDLDFLNNYIEIDEWEKVYNAYLINATNLAETKDNKFINQNIDKFHDMFIKYTIKHPSAFATHYLKADALLWSPFPIGYVYQYDFKLWGPDYGFANDNSSKILIFKKIYEKAITITMKRPIRIILYQPATIMYISFILLFILSKATKNKKFWFLCIPMIANIISLLPINLAQDLRYVYINYLTLAYVGLMCVVNFKDIFKYFNGRRLKLKTK